MSNKILKKSPFIQAIDQIVEEKGLDRNIVVGTIEQAIAAAYRKDYGKPRQLIRVKMDPESGEFKVFQVFEIVDNPSEEEPIENTEVSKTAIEGKAILKDNKLPIPKKLIVGDEIEIPLPFHDDFGRIAAQTAKQVIIQRLREAERDMLYLEYKDKEGLILPGNVQQIEGNTVIVNLGKTNALMLPSDQTPTEHYYNGQRIRVYVRGVEETPKGPRILVSRSSPELIRGLFELEVPEIQAGSVEISGLAREAGSRSKVAVSTNDPHLDPVGSCVGQRGTRIQAILAELGEEKIDIILYDPDIKTFLINALSPARIDKVTIDKKNNKAKVVVAEDQLSLAIGKRGQNVRLAGKIVGMEIDILRTGEKVKSVNSESEKSSEEPSDSIESDSSTDTTETNKKITSSEDI